MTKQDKTKIFLSYITTKKNDKRSKITLNMHNVDESSVFCGKGENGHCTNVTMASIPPHLIR